MRARDDFFQRLLLIFVVLAMGCTDVYVYPDAASYILTDILVGQGSDHSSGTEVSTAGTDGGGTDDTDGTRREDIETDGEYADMYSALGNVGAIPVRGRMVMEKGGVDIQASTPFSEMSQDELKDCTVSLSLTTAEGEIDLGTLKADDEGYVDDVVDLSGQSIPAGQHTLKVRYEDKLAGTTSVRVLDTKDTEILVRSDVDLTYLDTNFVSTTDKIKLLQKDAKERETLPAMEAVYSALRNGADGNSERSLVFLSGSPKFFKRVLEGKMLLDSVVQDGLVLKPYKDIIVEKLLPPPLGDFDLIGIIPALKEQIGYKLYWLLRLRQHVPPGAPEILLGDDSEADVAVYSLYHRFTAGALDAPGLMAELDKVGVSSDWKKKVESEAPAALAALAGNEAPVKAIYINKTGLDISTFPVKDWQVDGVTRYHQGAWPLALDMYASGWISKAHATQVKERLLKLGQDKDTLKSAAEHGIAQGYLKAETIAEFE